MSERLQKKKLGEIILKTETIDPTRSPENKFQYVDVSSVNNQKFCIESTSTLKGKEAPSRARKLIKTNDVIFATIRPTLKRIAIVPESLNNQLCSTGYFVIRANDSVVNHKLLFYFLQTESFISEMGILQKGASYPAVTDTNVKEQLISFPRSLSEQKRIVEILDEAFAVIDKAKANVEKNLQNAKELFESYLQNAFANRGDGWSEKKLGEIIVNVEYGSSSKSKSIGKIPVLRMGNIQSRRFVWDNLVFTDNKEEIAKYQLKYNDVLFNRTNSPELVGKTAIYKGERPAIFAGYLIRINRKEDLINADFLNYFLNSEKSRKYGFSVMTSSVNQANINGSKLKEYPIILPPLETQKIIVSKLDKLLEGTNKLVSIYQSKLRSLEALKISILQKAFSGQLTATTKTLIHE